MSWGRATGKRTRFTASRWLSTFGPLFDHFYFCDLAMKVVGVGSVGTLCSVVLLMASDDEPIFLLDRAHARSGDAMIAGRFCAGWRRTVSPA